MNLITIRPMTWQAAQQDLTLLRTVVFMQEQNVSAEDEWDGKDDIATHFLVRNTQGLAIGCARLLIETRPLCETQIVLHIGRVAVLKRYRQQGIGNQLMQFILSWCILHHSESGIYLHAQTDRITFYTRLGFICQGDIFIDAGIPHIAMWYKKITLMNVTEQI